MSSSTVWIMARLLCLLVLMQKASVVVAQSNSTRANFTVGLVMVDPAFSSDVLARDLQYYQGLLLVKEQLNSIGGIALNANGISAVDLQYEVIFVPPNTNATTVAAQSLADNPNIDALSCSPNVDLPQCATVAAAAKMIFFSPYASDEMCSAPTDDWGNDYDYTYCQFLESTTFYVGIFNEASRLGYKRTAIYWAGYYAELVSAASGAVESAASDYGLDLIYNASFNTLAASYSADGTLVYNQDILNMLIEARDADVELLVILTAVDSVYVLQMMESIGYSPTLLWMPIMASLDSWPYLAGEIYSNYVTATIGWYYTMSYSDPFWGDTATYSNQFLATYGSTPTEWAAAGSLVGVSLALAIQKGGDITFEKVNRGLGFVNDETFYGLVKFGQFNRNIGREPVTLQWQNEEMVFVLPSSIATGELIYPMVPWVCREEQEDRLCFEDVLGVSNWSQAAFTVISSLGITLLVLALIGVFRKQDSVIFNRASPLFCKLLILFGIGGYVSCMLFAIEPTEGNGDVLCPSRIWVLAYASTGVLASLFAKTWRLYRLFTRQKTIRRQAITDQQLLGIMAAIFTGTTLLMIGWTADSRYRPHFEIVPEASNSDIGIATCSVDSPWLWVNIAYFLLLNAWGAFLAYHVRKLPSSFNESKYIFFCLYNIFICIVVLLPIGAVMLKDTVNEDVTLCIGILFAFSSVMISIIGSKFLLLYVKNKEAVFREEALTMPNDQQRGSSHSQAGRRSSIDGSHISHCTPMKATCISTSHASPVRERSVIDADEQSLTEETGATVATATGGDDGDDSEQGTTTSSPDNMKLELAKAKQQLSAAVENETLLKQQSQELQEKSQRLREMEERLAEFERQQTELALSKERIRDLEHKIAGYERPASPPMSPPLLVALDTHTAA